MRRWRQLSTFWVKQDEELFCHIYSERPRDGDHQLSAHIYFEDWQRYTNKDTHNLPFGGLKSQVSYTGDIAQTLGY